MATSQTTATRAGTTLASRSGRKAASAVPPPVAVDRHTAERVLLALMFPTLLMPLASSMSRVALPVIRDDFMIPADVTAWVTTAYTLPFMIFMPVYGRLSDGVGRRRLLLAGVVIYIVGSALVVTAHGLGGLMVGRAVQGFGTAGMAPLGMALISTIFRKEEQGKVMGTWSSVGPSTSFVAPVIAGLLITAGGWRAAFVPLVVAGLIALIAVYRWVPSGLSTVRPHFLRSFDWSGVVLLAGGLTSLLFFLSSRPITGVAPLQDWRLLSVTVAMLGAFLWWELHRADPFVALGIFRDRSFSVASICASMRMVAMAAIGFLNPLYLVDVHHLSPAYVGTILIFTSGGMAITVRFGGQLADRWGSRWPVVAGLGIQSSVAVLLSLLPAGAPLWWIGMVLAYHGIGAGLMLAALHRAAMRNVGADEMGGVAGLYSMIRFAGMVVGTALAGVILQYHLDLGRPAIEAYQWTFLSFAGVGVFGLLLALTMREGEPARKNE